MVAVRADSDVFAHALAVHRVHAFPVPASRRRTLYDVHSAEGNAQNRNHKIRIFKRSFTRNVGSHNRSHRLLHARLDEIFDKKRGNYARHAFENSESDKHIPQCKIRSLICRQRGFMGNVHSSARKLLAKQEKINFLHH